MLTFTLEFWLMVTLTNIRTYYSIIVLVIVEYILCYKIETMCLIKSKMYIFQPIEKIIIISF